MPRALRVEKYPQEMWELYTSLGAALSFSLDLGSEKEAQAFRAECYGFVRALRHCLREELRSKEEGATERAKRLSTLIGYANSTTLSIKGRHLHFIPASRNEKRGRLADLLANAKRELSAEEIVKGDSSEFKRGLPSVSAPDPIAPTGTPTHSESLPQEESAGLYDTFTKEK